MIELRLGDCADALKTLPDNSVDALVTDPPAGISFMGKHWDDDKGGRKQWCAWMEGIMREAIRVMKPGAHGLVWALPRTSHWTATALEDAGFEIRDVITHLFGSGFPKSLDVSKAIDEAAGAEREVVGMRTYADGQEYNGGAASGRSAGVQGNKVQRGPSLETAPATDAAKQWQGWGTALKPANEHWILVRKPCSEKTVAANVLRWNTGALNIDASRIEGPKRDPGFVSGRPGSMFQEGNPGICDNKGRFPANLVLSHSEYCTENQCDIECAIKMLDAQSGTLKSGGGIKNPVGGALTWKKSSNHTDSGYQQPSSGGASRFFYCAKVSSGERGDSTHPTMKSQKLMRYLSRLITPPGGTVLDPFMGSGSTGLAAKSEGFSFIGIEREEEYFRIAKARIDACANQEILKLY